MKEDIEIREVIACISGLVAYFFLISIFITPLYWHPFDCTDYAEYPDDSRCRTAETISYNFGIICIGVLILLIPLAGILICYLVSELLTIPSYFIRKIHHEEMEKEKKKPKSKPSKKVKK